MNGVVGLSECHPLKAVILMRKHIANHCMMNYEICYQVCNCFKNLLDSPKIKAFYVYHCLSHGMCARKYRQEILVLTCDLWP